MVTDRDAGVSYSNPSSLRKCRVDTVSICVASPTALVTVTAQTNRLYCLLKTPEEPFRAYVAARARKSCADTAAPAELTSDTLQIVSAAMNSQSRCLI
jgi:hypothetical protein